MDTTCGEEVFFAADGHFELSFQDIGDLFVDMFVFRQGCVLTDLPDGEGAAVAMDHFPAKTRNRLFHWDVPKVLHSVKFGANLRLNNVPGIRRVKINESPAKGLCLSFGQAAPRLIVDKWISFGGLVGTIIVVLLQILFNEA